MIAKPDAQLAWGEASVAPALEMPITQLPSVGLPVRDWSSRRAVWWQRVVFFALIAPVAILCLPIYLVWSLVAAGWRELWGGPAEYSSVLKDGHVHWHQQGRLVGVFEHTGTPSANLPKEPS